MPRRAASDAIFTVLVAWWFSLAGCGPKPPVTRADIAADTLCWSKNIAHGRNDWLAEARTKWADPFVFTVHGDTEDGKNWWVAGDAGYATADIEAVAKLLADLMPDRDILIVSCNRLGIKPRMPKRVWYCPDKEVWSRPRRYCLVPPPPDVCADLSGFIEGTE